MYLKVVICLLLIFITWFGFQIYNGLHYIPCCGNDMIFEDGSKICSCKFSNESGYYTKLTEGCTNCSNCSWEYISETIEEYWLNYSMEVCVGK